MPWESQPGKGALFKNDKKQKDSQPDYRGELKITRDYKAGEIVRFGAWQKNSQYGSWWSLSESTPPPKNEQQYPREKVTRYENQLDDDVPF